jgi:hypothetical protein
MHKENGNFMDFDLTEPEKQNTRHQVSAMKI